MTYAELRNNSRESCRRQNSFKSSPSNRRFRDGPNCQSDVKTSRPGGDDAKSQSSSRRALGT